DAGERLVGIGAQRRNGGDADHDNEGQHHGVLDGRRAVFTLQKIYDPFRKLTHLSVLSRKTHVPDNLGLSRAEPHVLADPGRPGLPGLAEIANRTIPQELSFVSVPHPMLFLTLVNVLLALVPRAVMAVMQTTIIRANITAYSTAVGPSSRFKNSTIR